MNGVSEIPKASYHPTIKIFIFIHFTSLAL